MNVGVCLAIEAIIAAIVEEDQRETAERFAAAAGADNLYGALIDPTQGSIGAVRSGGDGEGFASGTPPPTTVLVAQYTGIVTVGEDGTAEVTFDMPDFNGTVRLMAIAWTANAIGHAFHMIRNGRAESALAGGHDALCQLVFAGFDSLQALAEALARVSEALGRQAQVAPVIARLG
mgnify:CR=1 FL=1